MTAVWDDFAWTPRDPDRPTPTGWEDTETAAYHRRGALIPPMPILVAARTYLIDALTLAGRPLEVAIVPPSGPLAKTKSYVLLSRPGSAPRSLFTIDYLIRVRVLDESAVDCHSNTDLIYGLMLAATHCRIDTPKLKRDGEPGSLWISKASPGDNGPSDFADEDIAERLFGLQFAVFWTVAGKPLRKEP